MKLCPVPDVMLPAKSTVRTCNVPVPADSVTPLADHVPAEAVALIQVDPLVLT